MAEHVSWRGDALLAQLPGLALDTGRQTHPVRRNIIEGNAGRIPTSDGDIAKKYGAAPIAHTPYPVLLFQFPRRGPGCSSPRCRDQLAATFCSGSPQPPPRERISATVVTARLPRNCTALRSMVARLRCASSRSR